MTVVVVDATRLERNLHLVLQILAISDRVVVYLNLVDEARRHGIAVDADRLRRELGVPVVSGVARSNIGIDELLDTAHRVATGETRTTPFRLVTHAPAVERAVEALAGDIESAFPGVPSSRWVAERLLNADDAVVTAVSSGELGQLGGDDVGAATRPPVSEADRTRVLDATQRLQWDLPPDFHDRMTEQTYRAAEQIAERAMTRGLRRAGFELDRRLDALLTSRWLGFPLMLAILAVVFWLTIEGANAPSAMLGTLLIDRVHPMLTGLGSALGLPWWLSGVLFDGIYLATAWVVAVMLPPMAIFFPLFTLLEDFGYLPRVAFNLDALFRGAGAHGKQALTMCMGFGCNAAGVVATRIIDSPRERLIAIITNNFSLCNGRWPTQILVASIFIGALAPAHLAGLVSAAAVVGIALLGVMMMFAASWLLSRTVLRGEATSFSLELPPYRPPQVLQTLYRSVVDRTLIVLWRAVVFAVPAGAGHLAHLERFHQRPQPRRALGRLARSDRSAHRAQRSDPGRVRGGHPCQRDRDPDRADAHRVDRRCGRGGAGRGCDVRARQPGCDCTVAARGRLDAAHGGEPDAVQSAAQPMLDDHLHHLQGNPAVRVGPRLPRCCRWQWGSPSVSC